MPILLVEDDPENAAYLISALREEGYTVDHAADGTDGLYLAASRTYDVIIMDRMLPRLDGLAVLEALRKSRNTTPVLILSALGDVDDRIIGLRAGGDDYMAKPYSVREVIARIEVLKRRKNPEKADRHLRVADLEIDLLSRTVSRGGTIIPLLDREYRLLEYLMRHAGQVVTRSTMLEAIWDYNFAPQTNVTDVHISRLRQKIDRDFPRPLIHTVRGAGYMLRAED